MDTKDKKEIIYLPIEDIIPNRFQPRLAFDEKELNELSNSIIKYGIIQPIVVRKTGEKFEIIAGERRYKASTLAGLSKIPAIITNTDDNTSAEIALLENIQRKNLTVIEEAKSFKKLMDRGFTQESLALKMGVSQSSIANKIRLLNLPKRVQDALLFNKISERHARSLLTINDENKQLELLDRIINEKLTVKQTEDEIIAFLNKDKVIEPVVEEIIEPKEEIIPEINVEPVPEIKEETEDEFNIVDKIEIPERIELPHEIEDEEVNEINVYDKIPDEAEIVNINVVPEEVSINVVPEKLEEVNINVVPERETTELPRYNPFLTNVQEKEIVEIPSMENIIPEEKEDEQVLENPIRDNHFATTVDSIRKCISSLNMGDKVTTTELDFDSKYQIIIEIDKTNI